MNPVAGVLRCPDCGTPILIVCEPGPSATAEFDQKLASHEPTCNARPMRADTNPMLRIRLLSWLRR